MTALMNSVAAPPVNEKSLLEILSHNVGFDDPQRWLKYAREHHFARVDASRVTQCPDCSAAPAPVPLGQYVYYSTLIHLRECDSCSLIWADAHIDPSTIRQHFELAYKDDEYFRVSRRAIFEHLVDVIVAEAPVGARVLDIGGARGDLMGRAVARRSDLRVTVHDLSKAATDWAARHFGFETITGDITRLAASEHRYDVVVLSDVLYYEPQLRTLWTSISRFVADGGSVVIRVPNKYPLIRLAQAWYRCTHSREKRSTQDRMRFLNPEHVFILRQRYLRRRLSETGFHRVRALPSPPLVTKGRERLDSLTFKLASLLNAVSNHRLVLTPGMVLVGRDHRLGTPSGSRAPDSTA